MKKRINESSLQQRRHSPRESSFLSWEAGILSVQGFLQILHEFVVQTQSSKPWTTVLYSLKGFPVHLCYSSLIAVCPGYDRDDRDEDFFFAGDIKISCYAENSLHILLVLHVVSSVFHGIERDKKRRRRGRHLSWGQSIKEGSFLLLKKQNDEDDDDNRNICQPHNGLLWQEERQLQKDTNSV